MQLNRSGSWHYYVTICKSGWSDLRKAAVCIHGRKVTYFLST